MKKKALIYDLDNTIYSVLSIGEELFTSLFKLIEESGDHKESINTIEDEIMRKPFQVVAASHNFSDELTQRGISLLQELTYEGDIKPSNDYPAIKKIPAERFLVTTGFLKLQFSKIRGMGIEQDFKEIHVVDPTTSTKTKKDVFADIMARHHYQQQKCWYLVMILTRKSGLLKSLGLIRYYMTSTTAIFMRILTIKYPTSRH